MGDVADMMLDGTLCEGCGVFMDGEECGFPRLCAGCARDRRQDGHEVRDTGLGGFQDTGLRKIGKPTPPKTKCPTCGKNVKQVGLNDHIRDAHKGKPATG